MEYTIILENKMSIFLIHYLPAARTFSPMWYLLRRARDLATPLLRSPIRCASWSASSTPSSDSSSGVSIVLYLLLL